MIDVTESPETNIWERIKKGGVTGKTLLDLVRKGPGGVRGIGAEVVVVEVLVRGTPTLTPEQRDQYLAILRGYAPGDTIQIVQVVGGNGGGNGNGGADGGISIQPLWRHDP